MVNYACAFSQSESGKYFESIIMNVYPSLINYIFVNVDLGWLLSERNIQC